GKFVPLRAFECLHELPNIRGEIALDGIKSIRSQKRVFLIGMIYLIEANWKKWLAVHKQRSISGELRRLNPREIAFKRPASTHDQAAGEDRGRGQDSPD